MNNNHTTQKTQVVVFGHTHIAVLCDEERVSEPGPRFLDRVVPIQPGALVESANIEEPNAATRWA
jgi:hypothetical protein